MKASPFFVRPEDHARPLNVVGEHITVLASGRRTGGYELFIQDGPEGSGPIPHAHPWDESFFVIRGEVEFSLGDDGAMVASVGTLVHVPAGAKHWFRWRKGGGAMLSITSRTGASQMFTEIDAEIAPDQPNLERLMAIAVRHGLSTWSE
ncbi:MAG: cupin domain-containing protein [Alphaproteobacteria bacterium]|nr:cupin domain-containing protein [Alphaproteobacteria bacterium]